MPIELEEFLQLSDGLDLNPHDHVVGHIYGLAEMSETLRSWTSLSAIKLVPVRGDGCGNYDCVDVGAGPTAGAVLFWDHEGGDQPAYLLGGSFAAYLDMWSDFVVEWLRARDPRADLLLSDPQLRARLAPLNR